MAPRTFGRYNGCMSQSQKNSKRKRLYLVNRDFQMRYAGAAALVGLLSTCLTAGLILFPLYQFEILRIPRFLPLPILGIMGAAAAVNIAIVGMLAIFITHKVAGPMYSLVRHFRQIEEEGIWSGDMKLRDGDDLGYVVRNFNGMMNSITGRLNQDLDALKIIREHLEDLSEQDEEKLAKTLQAVNDLETDIRSRLSTEKSDTIAS